MNTSWIKFWLFFFMLGAVAAHALVSEYGFTSAIGAYTEITGGTVLGTSANDNESFNSLPLGFSFHYNGITFSEVSVQTNGFLAMGVEVLNTYLPLSSSSGSNNVVAALSRDIKSREDGELSYLPTGTAPNRVFTVQWKNYRRIPSSCAPDIFNFQIQLHENGNRVVLAYGDFTAVDASVAWTVQVGLRGESSADFNNRTTTTNWSATEAGTASNASCRITSSVFPATGLVFIFSNLPRPAQDPLPVNLATDISPETSFSWNPGIGTIIGYKVYIGTNTPPSNLVNGIIQSDQIYITDLLLSFNTVYYWQIIPYNNYGEALECPIWRLTTHSDPEIVELPYLQNWDAVSVPALPYDWTKIIESTSTSATVSTYSSTTNAHSQPNTVRLYNSSDAEANLILVGPSLAVTLPVNSVRVKFWARSSGTGYPLSIGVLTDPTDPSTYTDVLSLQLTTTLSEYVVPFSGYTGNGTNIAFKHGLGGTGRYIYVDDIVFEHNVANDLGCITLNGNATPSVGESVIYQAIIFNWGTAPQNDYTVKLLDGDEVELASATGVAFAAGTSVEIPLTWTPIDEGSIVLKAKVLLIGDSFTANDLSQDLNILVVPAGANIVTIGNGTSANTASGSPTPYGTYYKNFRQQYLYTADEITAAGGLPGLVTYISFNVLSVNDCSPMSYYSIRMKQTEQSSLSTIFEVGEYTQVWNQNSYMPIIGWNTHQLTTPFIWDGSSNLLVDIVTSMIPGNFTQNASVYHTETTGTNTCLRFQSDSVDASTATTGTASVNRANIRIINQAIDPPNPVSIVSPADNAINVPLSAPLNWSSDDMFLTGYKVHFGLSNPPPLAQNTGSSTYDPNLTYSTTYYWQIIPFNAAGDASNCPVWSFTTQPNPEVTMLPYAQNWDQVTAPELPFDWTAVIQSVSSDAVAGTRASTIYSYSQPNCARLYNPNDAEAILILAGPPLAESISVSDIILKFWSRGGGVNFPLSIGVMTNPTDPDTYIETHSLTVTTNLTEYMLSMQDYSGPGSCIAFKHGLGGAGRSIYIDDIMYERHEPPLVTAIIPDVSINMNSQFVLDTVETYFYSSLPGLHYEIIDNEYVDTQQLADGQLLLIPQQNWYGTTILSVEAVDMCGWVAEQSVVLTSRETWMSYETFNNEGVLPDGWGSLHSGTTTFPWQPILLGDDNYVMKTMATVGGTVNERMLSFLHDLTDYKEIQVSFDSEFLPYSDGLGSFAYTLNNVSYTVVDAYSTSHTGLKTYSVPVLDGKSSVRFRWLYSNPNANIGQDNFWTVDNFIISGLVRDTQVPSPVGGLHLIVQDNNSAMLGWDPSYDTYFGKYELYISTDSVVDNSDQLWSVFQDSELRFMSTTQTNITPLEHGEYWIAIRAVDQSNNVSQMSDPVFVFIDRSGPVFTDPLPAGQPEPDWFGGRVASIGCKVSDFNLIDPNSIQYRYDKNGNGIYDESETWLNISRLELYDTNRDTLDINVDVEYDTDGSLPFEFRAADIYGNVGYSGINESEGIVDDWVVRIDSTPPVISDPVPTNQPDPDWMTREVVLGCTVSNSHAIISVEFRYDRNGNGVYDFDESWQNVDNFEYASCMLNILQSVIFEADGLCRFEFRALNALGNIGYSGDQNAEGINDDWLVRIDTTAPLFVNPVPANQPDPVWIDSMAVIIGATVQDMNAISEMLFRYDANRNGVYDDDESWQQIQRQKLLSTQSDCTVTIQLDLTSDGHYCFEFKAIDNLGNIGYSGNQNIEGINDDWLVRIDTTAPQFFNPEPEGQPLPVWSNTTDLVIGALMSDASGISNGSVMYRIDENQNGVYDPEEAWQVSDPVKSNVVRNAQFGVIIPVFVTSDGIYKFELKATDLCGTIGFSGLTNTEGIDDDWVFRVDSTPPVDISSFFVQDVSDTTILLTWSASSDLNFAGYMIYYSNEADVSEADMLWDNSNDPVLAYAGEGLVFSTVAGLEPATRYYFLLQATDEAGWVTQHPVIVTAMTSSAYEPQVPQHLSISVQNEVLSIDWDDVTQDIMGNTITVSHYEVHVSDQPYFDCSFDTLLQNVESSQIIMEGLTEYADRLFFKVIAVSGAIRHPIVKHKLIKGTQKIP